MKVSTDLERAVLGLHDLAAMTTASAEEVLGGYGLSLTSGLALWWLDPDGDPRTMGELASAMRCSPANVTYLLDRLDSAGLVHRAVAATDRRRRVITLTPRGVELRAEVVAAVVRDSPLGRLTPRELDTLLHVVDIATR